MKRLTLRETQEALLGLLTEFDRVCREHGLKYSLAAGTLLGAVRHKGFIPWDDDVDVYMPRPEYEKFIKIVSEGNVLGENFSITKDRGKGTYYPFVKLLDHRYPLKSPNHIEVPYLYLDIFPVDGVPVDMEESKKLFKKERFWVISAGICQFYTMDSWWGFIAYVIGWWFYLGTKLFIGAKRSVRKMNEYATLFPYEKSEMAALHNWGRAEQAIPSKCFDDLCELEFEGKKFMAIKDWDLLLTNTYGDYMTPPPVKKQKSRHYIRVYPAKNAK
ncbi:MAG: LicD family protein [Clostridia bacterium]|nr:LicD family protein [Clostridia bacterium]